MCGLRWGGKIRSASADLDDCDEKPLLVLLVHGPADGTDGPAERVQVPPRPLRPVHLVVQLLSHDTLRVGIVKVSQVHCRTKHNSNSKS